MTSPLFFNRTHRWIVLILLAIGLALRLAVAIKMGLNNPPDHLGSDSDEYDTYAWNMAQGLGYRGSSPGLGRDAVTAFRTPGTSLVWAGLFRVFGHRYDVIRVTHCLLGTGIIFWVYALGSHCFSSRVGLLAAALYTVWPTAIFYSRELGSEPLAVFCFMAYLWAALRLAGRPVWGWALAAGALLGFSLLVRGGFILMVPLAGLWALWQFRRQPRALWLGLLVPFLAVTALVPWTIRNYRVFHTFIPLATEGGEVLLGANNTFVVTNRLYYGYQVIPATLPEYRELLRPGIDEVTRDHIQVHLALEWLRQNPQHWWYLIHSKFRRSWTPVLHPPVPRSQRIVMFATWTPILLLFAPTYFITLVVFLRRQSPHWLLHLVIVQFQLTNLIFYACSRYRYPIEGLCIIFAAAAVFWLGDRLGRRPALPQIDQQP